MLRAMTNWEYLIVQSTPQSGGSTHWAARQSGPPDGNLHQELIQISVNETEALRLCGNRGWELVALRPGDQGAMSYYFKRPQ